MQLARQPVALPDGGKFLGLLINLCILDGDSGSLRKRHQQAFLVFAESAGLGVIRTKNAENFIASFDWYLDK